MRDIVKAIKSKKEVLSKIGDVFTLCDERNYEYLKELLERLDQLYRRDHQMNAEELDKLQSTIYELVKEKENYREQVTALMQLVDAYARVLRFTDELAVDLDRTLENTIRELEAFKSADEEW